MLTRRARRRRNRRLAQINALRAVTNRLKARRKPESSYDAAIRVWSDAIAREVAKRSGVFGALRGKP